MSGSARPPPSRTAASYNEYYVKLGWNQGCSAGSSGLFRHALRHSAGVESSSAPPGLSQGADVLAHLGARRRRSAPEIDRRAARRTWAASAVVSLCMSESTG